ncbi:phage major tail protein, phi13 family [Butyrivibrio sp. M55]|nr:major tail protein [Butyrivibrio sp. M55]SFU89040.1 phage major tail protein, phi13 family [Butyrivibrio sp. M55]
MSKNKVKFNLKNAHYAMLSIAADGTVSYGTPVALPGAVSISLDANGEPENFYADGVAYYVINNNMGYDGDLELAIIPESFRVDALNETLDDNNVLVENANTELNSFALLFEFDGDVRHIRHVLYNCSASRPGIEGQTNEESRQVQTETLTIKATPLASGVVKAKTGDTTDSTTYNNWYNAVYMPADVSGADVTLSALSIGALTLTPAFDSATTSYAVTTSNATNTVSATATDPDAGVVITVNGDSVTDGSSVTWEDGTNAVVVTVSNGGSNKTYTVTVTKE